MRDILREFVLKNQSCNLLDGDFKDAVKRSLFHLLVCGSTGSGKSAVVSDLINNIEGDVVVIDPFASKEDWDGLMVIRIPIPLSEYELQHHRMSRGYVEHMLSHPVYSEISAEIKRRRERWYNGDRDFTPLNFVLEEVYAPPTKINDLFDDCEKVRIRYIFISCVNPCLPAKRMMMSTEEKEIIAEHFNIVTTGIWTIKNARHWSQYSLLWSLEQRKYPATINEYYEMQIPEYTDDLYKINPREAVQPETQDLVDRIKANIN
jgi:hypothetical protein